MKVMLDTNILVSAFVFKSKIMNDLIYKISNNYEIIICSYIIEELNELIKYKFKIKQETLQNFFNEFPYTLVHSPTQIKNKLFKIRDDNDYIILHTAIMENVDIFITGDKDFYEIDIDKPKIMSVSEFLKNY